MKKIIPLLLSLMLLLCSCNTSIGSESIPSSDELPQSSTDQMGYPSNEVQRPQIMYKGIRYYYEATGFDDPLPSTYSLVGKVETVDNLTPPTKDWSGSRVDIGQNIYADASIPDIIYLEYENGYAKYSQRDE